MQLTINDYNFDSATANQGWAQVEIFGKTVEFNFSCYDAVTAAIELGYIEQPDDRDQVRIGYENPAFSATVRELLASDVRVSYQQNNHLLSDFYATEFGLQIITRLALQSRDVREVIQAEATSLACCDCPANITDYKSIMEWFANNGYEEFLCGLVNWDHVSQHKIASFRTENKLVQKLI